MTLSYILPEILETHNNCQYVQIRDAQAVRYRQRCFAARFLESRGGGKILAIFENVKSKACCLKFLKNKATQ